MSDDRREHLLLVVDHLLATWNAWNADSDMRFLNKTFEDAIEDCLAVWAVDSIPGDLRTLHARVEELAPQWQAWNEKNERSGGRYPMPDQGFWRSLENIEAAREAAIRPVRRRLESIAQLDAEKVSPAQICKIYGFVTDQGTPEYWKLDEERAHPGKHTGEGTGWMPPASRRDMERDTQRLAALERVKSQRETKMRLLTRVAKETIEELIATGVSGKQICKMKKLLQVDLETYCQEHNLELPEWEAASANSITAPTDYSEVDEDDKDVIDTILEDADRPAVRDAVEGDIEEADGGPMTLEQEIILYHQGGNMSAAEIASAVSTEGNPISFQKVTNVIKRFERDPSAFDTVEA